MPWIFLYCGKPVFGLAATVAFQKYMCLRTCTPHWSWYRFCQLNGYSWPVCVFLNFFFLHVKSSVPPRITPCKFLKSSFDVLQNEVVLCCSTVKYPVYSNGQTSVLLISCFFLFNLLGQGRLLLFHKNNFPLFFYILCRNDILAIRNFTCLRVMSRCMEELLPYRGGWLCWQPCLLWYE